MDAVTVCPKCEGLLVDDDAFLEHLAMWLRYKKCINCGRRVEIGTYRRFTQRSRSGQDRKKVQSRHYTRQTNSVDGYTWSTDVDRDSTVPTECP